MHLSQETFDQIASLLQNDAKQFRRRKMAESILFKKKDSVVTITLDNMGIGKLVMEGGQFIFSSHSALGETFNGKAFTSLEECQEAIVAHMMGEKPEVKQLDEEVQELAEGAITVEKLKVGKVYTLEAEDGTKFKGKITNVKEKTSGVGKGGWIVTYTYVDGSYSTKGTSDKFVVTKNMKVFYESVEELDEGASYEKGMDPKKKVTVQGVKGMKSRPFKKTFPNMAAYEKWADSPAAEDVDVSRVFQEEVEEIDESNTTPFFLDAKTRKPMSPADEIKALQNYIKRARSESGSGSDQRLYLATQRLQYLSARVVKEEDELNEAGERLGVKSAQFDKLDAWEGRAKAKGFKVTKNNKSGTYYAWNGTKVVGTFNAHGKHFGGELREEADCDEDDKKDKKKGKKKDGEELDMDPKAMKESFKDIVARLKEDHLGGRKDGYALYHPTYSAAVQEALKWAQRKGFKVNEDDYFNKVSTGPRKPTPGKTVSHSLALENNKKKMLHLQVYNTGNSFELNCYVS